MSFFRFSRLFTASNFKSRTSNRSGAAGSQGKRASRGRKRARPRRLQFDPLESRELLSVSPADLSDMLVSQQLDLYNAAFPEPNLRADYPAQSQFTDAARALAGDNDGDFVVTWTRNDPVIDPNSGLPVIDPRTGQPRSDLNIYARYLTDEVQRIFLPSAVLNNSNPAPFTNGTFELRWGGNEVQKISITATNPPLSGITQNIQGTITLGFDLNDNGIIDISETTTIVCNENNFAAADESQRPQSIIQTQLRGLGGVLTDVVVEATDPHTYIVYFGDASQGNDQPEIVVVDQSYTAGVFPAALVSTIRQPTLISNIPVASSANSPSLNAWAAARATAAEIERAFAQQTSESYVIAPVDVQPPDLYSRTPPSPAPYDAPLTRREPISVSVTPVDLTSQGYALGTVFDITFVGAHAKQDVPLMVITEVKADNSTDLTPLLQADPVKTMKQSSPEFRVNPAEPVNPVTGQREPTDQRNPAVAMDADGDFVITWESDIPDSILPGSVSDIYARRFSPMGIIDDTSNVRGFVTDGVRSWVNDIQVVTFDPNLSGPLVGSFKIEIPHAEDGTTVTSDAIIFDSRALAKVAADVQTALVTAGYTGARVRPLSGVAPYQFEITFGGRQAGLDVDEITIVEDTWSAPSGVTVSVGVEDRSDSTFRVNTTTTNRQVTPAIGMDAVGNFIVAWANVAQDLSFFNRVAYQRFDRNGDPIGSETLAPTQTPDITAVYLNPAVALSPDGHYALAWETTMDPAFYQGGTFTTSISALIYDQTGTPGNFLALGGSASGNPSLAFDPANNLAVAWNVIVADNLGGSATMDSQAQVFRVNGTTLRAPFRINSATGSGLGTANWSLSQVGPQMGFDADGDLIASYSGYGVDLSNRLFIPGSYFASFINDTTNADLKAFFDPANDSLLGIAGNSLMSSDVDGAIEYILYNAQINGATPTQIGRLRAILDEVAGLLRGDANGVMFSRWDTDPNQQSPNTVLTADNQANSNRDGQNTRILLAVPRNASAGTLTPTLVRWDLGANNSETVTINVAYQQIGNVNVVNPVATLDAIRTAFNNARLVGDMWPANGNWYYPNDATRVQVRRVFGAELDARSTTAWAFPWTSADNFYVYELNFQGDAHDAPFSLGWPGNSARLDTPTSGVFVFAESAVESWGNQGTPQINASLAVTRSGDFTVAWTEQALYTNGSPSNTNIVYRRFRDDAGDTAGPVVTDVLRADGVVLYDGDTIRVPEGQPSTVTQLIINFDEEMLANGVGSVTNPGNYRLLQNGVELVGGIRSVQFGMNKAADLGIGGLPPNKWQAVLFLDGNGTDDGVPPLPMGQYEIQLIPGSSSGTGLFDKWSNPLGSSGYLPEGSTFSRTFSVDEVLNPPPVPPSNDVPVTAGVGLNGRTHPESPNAVAADADGDYVVVWTAPDGIGRDSIYFRLFNADGTPATSVLAAAPLGTSVASLDDAQRYASVAMDADGDFVITWTFFDGQDTDVYARRFNSMGVALDSAFRVNSFITNEQKWSDVAVDADGDFVIVWTSFGQENPTIGTGYGIYARRYDRFGAPLAQEFQVNVTTGGDQMFPSVAMDSLGGFVVTWTSNANGVGNDIMYRSFLADGTPVPGSTRGEGSLFGEGIVNQTLVGEQRYSDVAMLTDGSGFVVTWSSAGQDGSGDGVYARTFPRAVGPVARRVYDDPDIPPEGSRLIDNGLTVFDINVTDVFAIADLNVSINIRHPRVSDLMVTLVDPQGVPHRLVERRPRIIQGNQTVYLDGANFSDTIFDDQALTAIGNYPTAQPPYTGRFIPEQALTGLNNSLAMGTWQLRIDDQRTGPFDAPNEPTPAFLDRWTLDFQPTLVPGNEFRVNTSTASDQTYPSVAVDRSGRFVVTWSGRGNQPGQEDASGSGGVFFQRYTANAAPVGLETRANKSIDGDQRFSSVASDADGNFFLVWMGPAATPGATEVYVYRSNAVLAAADTSAPWVTDVIYNGESKSSGDVLIGSVTELQVAFDEFMAVGGSTTGVRSVVNPSNWRLVRNGTELPGMVQSIAFPASATQRDSATRKFVATLQFASPLPEGEYSLTVKDSIFDGFKQATDGPNALDGDYDGRAGTDGSITGDSGYRFDFSVLAAPTGVGAEIRVNENVRFDQRFSSHYGAGLAVEQSNHSLAVDHDGDFVVVWTSYGQEDRQLITFDATGSGSLQGVFQLTMPHAISGLPVTSAPITFNSSNLDGVATGIRNALVAAGYTNAKVRVLSSADPYQFEITVGSRLNVTYPWLQYVPSGMAATVSVADGTDPTNAGVYARIYDRLGDPLTDEFQVNTFVAGDQRNPSVAIDADGDFIVVWESQGQDPNGTWGIYARRFDSMGVPAPEPVLGSTDEFRVNTWIANDQVNPAVAMDDFGNFVIAWATGGQSYSYFNDIRGQLFDRNGERVDREFLVTRQNIPGVNQPGSSENNPAVAMDPFGTSFVVAWDQVTQQQDGAAINSVIYARLFSARDDAGNWIFPSSNTNAEFRVDDGGDPVTDAEHDTENASGGTTTRRQARNPQIAMGVPADTDGDGNPDRAGFIVAWESFHDNDGESPAGADSYGIYFRRFAPDGTPEMEEDHQANFVITLATNNTNQLLAAASTALAGHQVNPSVAMDADGDYVVVWNGPGAQVHPIDPTSFTIVDADPDGISIRNFHAQDPADGLPEFVSVQTRVNRTRQGIQEFPAVGMTRSGGRVVAWSGRGSDDLHGIYFRRYPEPTDTAGPQISDVLVDGVSVGVSVIQPKQATTTSTPPAPIVINSEPGFVGDGASSVVLVFDEDMFADLPPITDPLDFDYILDSVYNPDNYALLKDGADVSGLISNNIGYRYNPDTNKYELTLLFDADPATPELEPLPDGSYTLLVFGNLRDKMGNPMGVTGLFQNGLDYISTSFSVGAGSSDPSQADDIVNLTTAGQQDSPAVAAAADGSYVVVWVSYGTTVSYDVGGKLTSRVSNSSGTVTLGLPFGSFTGRTQVDLTWTGGSRLGMTGTVNGQRVTLSGGAGSNLPAVGTTMTVTIRIIDGANQGNIVGQMFDARGRKLGPEFLVNTYLAGSQIAPDVAMDSEGNFVVVWSGQGQHGLNGPVDTSGIFYRRFNSEGAALDLYQQRANTYTRNRQDQPAVDMDPDGNFVIVWAGEGRQGNPKGRGAYDSRGVWVRRYGSTGLALDTYQVLVNTTKTRSQDFPDVAMDGNGNYYVVWRSERQGAGAWSIYGQQFTESGTRVGRETRLNTKTYGAKLYPEVAMDDAGNRVVVWSGLRSQGYGDRVYMRSYLANGTAREAKEFAVDSQASAAYLKQQASVAITPDGTSLVVSWTSFAQDGADEHPTFRDDGVYAHLLYNATPDSAASAWSDYTTNGSALGDFRLNGHILGSQNDSYVAISPAGSVVAVWVGPDPDDIASGLDIWQRRIAFNGGSAGGAAASHFATGSVQASLQAAAAVAQQRNNARLNDSVLGTPTSLGPTFFGPATSADAVPLGSAVAPSSGGVSGAASVNDSALAALLGQEEKTSGLLDLESLVALGNTDLTGLNAKVAVN